MSILRAERLVELRLDKGERFPSIAVEGAAPPVMTTIYTVSMLRSGGRSPNTIAAHLRAIMIARRWADGRGFSLEDRMRAGRFLAEPEIEDLVRTLRSRQQELHGGPSSGKRAPATSNRSSGDEYLRRLPKDKGPGLDTAEAAKRIGFVRNYLV